MTDTAVFFFKNPKFESLLTVKLVYDEGNSPEDMARQKHIYKARELLFTDNQLIATPTLYLPYSVTAILKISYFESKLFKDQLRTMNLTVVSTCPVVPSDFQACLRYTALAKMAPLWNKVGQYLCQGRDFLLSTGILPAIEWKILVTETETEVTLAACGVKLQLMRLSDIWEIQSLNAELMDRLRCSEVEIEPVPCFVLPSLKAASIVSVSFKGFASCPYSSYANLRKFWKNTYGYRIPEEARQTMIYVRVLFGASRDSAYTYPILCVRPRQPIVVPRVNPYPILGTFLRCFEAKLREVCGEGLALVLRKPSFPTASLKWTARDAHQVGIHNVSWTNKPSGKPIPYKKSVSYEPYPCTNFVGRAEAPTESSNVEKGSQLPAASSQKIVPHFASKQQALARYVAPKKGSIVSNCAATPQGIPGRAHAMSAGPTFLPTAPNSEQQILSATIKEPTPCRPLAVAAKAPMAPLQLSQVGIHNVSWTNTPSGKPIPYKKSVSYERHQSTNFVGRAEAPTEASNVEKGSQLPAASPQKIVPHFANKQQAQARYVAPKNGSIVSNGAATPQGIPGRAHAMSAGPTSLPTAPNSKQQILSATIREPTLCRPPAVAAKTPMAPLQLSQNSQARTKKPKQSRVHSVSDIDALLKDNKYEQLQKVNASSLIGWLRSKGVSCRVNDKKQDLVLKVVQSVKE